MRTIALLMTFLSLAAAADEPAPPCGALEWRQLDFWLGEWDVTAQGQPVARSTIEKVAGTCVVREHYTQADGFSGVSLSFFDPVLRTWRQTWVDSLGNVSDFSGSLSDGAMRLEGSSHRVSGETLLRKMTLTSEDGGVRQYSERSADSGRTWTVAYDFQYVRRDASQP